MNGLAAAPSKTAARSSITLPPQSREISSTKRWPNPVEPRGLGATTTQPCAAHRAGFHRYDQPSDQAPWGPPWIMNTTGYFRDRKSTRLNSSHLVISYAVFCLKKKK